MTARVEHPIAVEAHLQAAPLVVKRPQDWTISSARAGNVWVMLQRLGVTRNQYKAQHGPWGQRSNLRKPDGPAEQPRIDCLFKPHQRIENFNY